MTAEDQPVYALAFKPLPQAAVAARILISEVLTGWGLTELIEAATLIATELIANAIRSKDHISLKVYLADGFLHLEVFDTSPELPKRCDGDLLDECGKGHMLVEAYATDWGFRLVDGGKVVWAMCGPAELRRPS